jgi:hypothetical protein
MTSFSFARDWSQFRANCSQSRYVSKYARCMGMGQGQGRPRLEPRVRGLSQVTTHAAVRQKGRPITSSVRFATLHRRPGRQALHDVTCYARSTTPGTFRMNGCLERPICPGVPRWTVAEQGVPTGHWNSGTDIRHERCKVQAPSAIRPQPAARPGNASGKLWSPCRIPGL